jgi:parvulin-like peptidyl-prolyl isomerase
MSLSKFVEESRNMMRFVLSFLALACLAMAQETTPPAASPAPGKTAPPSMSSEAKSSEAQVSPEAAVITIKGICNSTTAAPKSTAAKTSAEKTAAPKTASTECKTVVTRAEFEKLAEILQVPPSARKQFASQYAMQLVISNAARKRGLDHGPRYEQLLKLARMQVLTRQLAQDLQEESAKVPDSEIEDYYNKNKSSYEEATLERLYIPRAQQMEPSKETLSEADTKKRQEDSEAAMKKEADDLRARAAAGEDFKKLQEEAYKFANFKASPPDVKMEKTRRTTLPASQAVVLDMKPGEVSAVFGDPGGYFVYKLESKDTIPLERVRDEIHSSLQKQRMQNATQAMQQSATPTFNDSYFGSAPAGPSSRMPMGAVGPHPPATAPPTGPK